MYTRCDCRKRRHLCRTEDGGHLGRRYGDARRRISVGRDCFVDCRVFAEFCRQINENLKAGKNVFADATHLNELSRRKLLNGVRGYRELEAVVLSTVCEEAIKRNSNRKGTRSFVPESAIKRMSSQFVFPDLSEGFSTIYSITPDEPIVVLKGVK